MKDRNFNLIVYAMMVVAVIYSLVQGLLGNIGTLHFKITLGIWIVAAVAVIDFVAPLCKGELFKGSTKKNLAYILFAICDAGMYVCLYIFIINITMSREPLHYIYLAISAVMFLLRTFIYKLYSDIPGEGALDSVSTVVEETTEEPTEPAQIPMDEGTETQTETEQEIATTEETAEEAAEAACEKAEEIEAESAEEPVKEPAEAEPVVEENTPDTTPEPADDEPEEIKEIIYRERKK